MATTDPDPHPKSRKVTVCSNCLTASCWHAVFMCDASRMASTVERTVAELDAMGREHPSNYTVERVREMTTRPKPLDLDALNRDRAAAGTPASSAADSARILLTDSLRERSDDLRRAAERARSAYGKPGPLRDASLRLAGAYSRAAAVLDAELRGEPVVVVQEGGQ